MYFKIAEVSRHESGLLYVLVEFWRNKADADSGDPPHQTNDFLMQLVRQYSRIEERPVDGWWHRLDDVYINPTAATREDHEIGWFKENITKTNAELRQEVRQHIVNYWRRAKAAVQAGKPYKRKQDQRYRLIRSRSDNDGILARVSVLQGSDDEVANE